MIACQNFLLAGKLMANDGWKR